MTALQLVLDKGYHIEKAVEKTGSTTALLRAIVSGVIRQYESLDQWLQSRVKLKPKDRTIRYLLMSAMFQHQHLQNCRQSDLIFLAAESTAKINRSWAKGLVYATLKQLNQTSVTPDINLPEWLQKKIKQAHGQAALNRLGQLWSTPPQLCCLRVNTCAPSVKTLESSTACSLYPATQARHAPLALAAILSQKEAGQIYVQDCIHQDIIQQLPQLPHGSSVLDACASPGGKSTALLNQQHDIKLLAIDKKAQRMPRLQQNLAPYPQACCLQADALKPEAWWDGKHFDAILCDAPCSGTGTLHKNPEIKYHQTPENIKKLSAQQYALLQTLWSLLKPGGTLLYSTCSILPEENAFIVDKFIRSSKYASEACLIQQHSYMPDGTHGGGYFARIQKKKNIENMDL